MRTVTLIGLSAAMAIGLAVLLVAAVTAEPAGQGSIGLFQHCANQDGDGFDGNPGNCAWISHTLGTNNSLYAMHDAVPQRILFRDLLPGQTYWVTLAWQTTVTGKHAYDYLIDFNHSETWVDTARLCAGAMDCSGLTPDTMLIPKDPRVTRVIRVQPDGYFRMFKGDMTAMSAPIPEIGSYNLDSTTVFTITFIPNAPEVLMAWGAHIASESDWRLTETAKDLPGTPYQMLVWRCSPNFGSPCGKPNNSMSMIAPSAISELTFEASQGNPQGALLILLVVFLMLGIVLLAVTLPTGKRFTSA